MKKQNILIIGLILLAVISFGIFILVSGKGNTGSLETTKDIIKMINTIDKDNKNVLPELETMKVDVKNIDEVTSYTGLKTNDDIESIVVSVPMMTSQAYSVAVVKVKDTANVEKIKQEMLDNIDMRRWICVSAEQLYITNSGNVIFSVMADKDIAKVVYNDFKKYVNNNIGKELEKSNDEENIELPPEMPAAPPRRPWRGPHKNRSPAACPQCPRRPRRQTAAVHSACADTPHPAPCSSRTKSR